MDKNNVKDTQVDISFNLKGYDELEKKLTSLEKQIIRINKLLGQTNRLVKNITRLEQNNVDIYDLFF